MKVLQVSHSDIGGGAFRASYRIHKALREYGIDSKMIASRVSSGDWTVSGSKSKFDKAMTAFRNPLAALFTKSLKTDNHVLHSPAILPSGLPSKLNNLDVDLLHLHWVNAEMLSISDIGKLKKPLVWTLHDMWAFCGAEHYSEDERWRLGYTPRNRPKYESGFDLNLWTWKRKRKHWKNLTHIVTPSNWLADCVKQSELMGSLSVDVIPYAIDTQVWQPADKVLARRLLNLPTDVPLILFGAIGGAQDPRKGFDLLVAALSHLKDEISDLEIVVFGQLAPEVLVDYGFTIHYVGFLHDDVSLRLLYSAADVMIVPSRQEAFGQTGSEPQACGCPVAAFDSTGLMDVVEHQKTGYLAKAFDPIDLATGLSWMLSDSKRLYELGQSARKRALDLWSNKVVAAQYAKLYSNILAND